MSTAEVVEFPEEGLPDCSKCHHYLIGPSGDFCHLFLEPIMETRVAIECDGYEP